jgi:hypothetical protein
MFKGHLGRTDYRALYYLSPDESELIQLHGGEKVPESITASMVSQFFKYSTGSKEYKALVLHNLNNTFDAISLKKECQVPIKKKGIL